MSDVRVFDDMIGQTFERVVALRPREEREDSWRSNNDDALEFLRADGSGFRFYHSQDCCESVNIEDICGELSDLQGSPLVEAEEVSSKGGEPPPPYPDSWTWTFYKFGTSKGSVTVRWLGESNGYYSESVSRIALEATP